MKKIIIAICSLLVCFMLNTNSSAAASSVRVSSATAVAGDKVTVTLSVKSDEMIGGFEAELKYKPEHLEYIASESQADWGGGGSLRFLYDGSRGDNVYSLQYKLVFKTKNVPGITAGLDLSNVLLSRMYKNEQGDVINASIGNGSVKINAPKVASSDANLASLSVGGHSFSPAFSKDQTNYTMSVKNSVKDLTIRAVANDKNARVSISGNKNLKVGTNAITIKVVAENGSSKTYTIKVSREGSPTATKAPITPEETKKPEATQTPEATTTPEPTVAPTVEPTKEPVKVTVADKELSILEEVPTEQVTDSYKEVVYNYKDQEVKALKDSNSGRVLLYLSDEKLYIYDEMNDNLTQYQPIVVGNTEYVILDAKEDTTIPTGYEKASVMVNGKEVELYKASNESPFYLFYGSNQKGQEALYSYDAEQETIQRYHTIEETKVETEENEETSNEVKQLRQELLVYKAILAFIGTLFVVGLIVVIIIKIRERRN